MTGALSEAETKLAEALLGRNRRVAVEVLEAVAKLFEITVADLTGPRKRMLVVDARSVVALILRNRGYTLAEIGAVLHRDYSTAYALCKRIERDHELSVLARGLAA